MLGVNLEQEQVTTEVGRVLPVKTLSDLTEELEDEETFFEMGFGPVTLKIRMLLENFSCYRSERFDLIAMGPRWAEGDYRVASFLFEFIIPSIGENYKNILIDSPAGLEHLNRRVVSRVNDLFTTSAIDTLIAALAIEYDCSLLHRDSHFDLIACHWDK